ncbi:hypothetical protein GCM10007897_25490 [Sphingobium jiangsuense]|uniref:Flagellar biosynthesis/type III secretory pathway M-ring protein FliF/YscJ n=1 Tax=Sphingobium jiangsuense TaxID=870476 RepID=A0A7W6FRT3_9SPHN|nr:hypothetical protein [Sphingobium jiangsuense]MBB3928333.1 flagellar biosynthesis/type III secretory pathway M-ring protein FliF/YscJ [Sphingobium jiangsuense]GLT01158.1 hypothetical protein GCM10007897_25490 [Sphingobium jiangsuense]
MIAALINYVRGSTGARIVLAGLAVALLVGLLIRWIDRAQDHAVTQATETGRAEQRADDQAEVLNKVEKAKDAQEAIRRDDDAARAQCVRYSRTPENC